MFARSPRIAEKREHGPQVWLLQGGVTLESGIDVNHRSTVRSPLAIRLSFRLPRKMADGRFETERRAALPVIDFGRLPAADSMPRCNRTGL